jgi:hypothetical protein
MLNGTLHLFEDLHFFQDFISTHITYIVTLAYCFQAQYYAFIAKLK